MTIRMRSLGLPAGLLAALLLTACQNTARGIQEDTEQNTEAARDAASEASSDAERASREAARKTENALENTGNVLDAAAQTVQIKTALMADKAVDASGVDVDTSGTTMTVTLKGHVKSAAQKDAAEQIARDKAPGYTIVNTLTIEP